MPLAQGGVRGALCFFVLSGGSTIIARSKSTSLQRNCPISFRRWPVRNKRRITSPNLPLAAHHTCSEFAFESTRSRLGPSVALPVPVTGLVSTIPL